MKVHVIYLEKQLYRTAVSLKEYHLQDERYHKPAGGKHHITTNKYTL